MTEAMLRQIIREELQAVLGQQSAPAQPVAGQVISLERRMEIKRQAQLAMAEKRRK